MADIEAQIKAQGELVRELKAKKADSIAIQAEIEKLVAMKAQVRQEKGDTAMKYVLKCPRGTRDYDPRQMAVREKVLDKVIAVFKRHGAESIDTPVFELRETLMGKYGEEGGKLVYDLDDQGGELLSMRYDLTVPFARYCAMNRITNIKRYHIAKVYRRDNPRMTRGRYREFYQCDFDIAGTYDKMLPEIECLKIVDEILSDVNVGTFVIKVNHRLLLDAFFEFSHIKKAQFKTVCSSVDKLDKEPWKDVRKELIVDKKIDEAAVEQLGVMLAMKDASLQENRASWTVLDKYAQNESFMKVKAARQAIEELKLLQTYINLVGIEARVCFEPSLARGLDYYTGVIYEAVIDGALFAFESLTVPFTEFSTSSEAKNDESEEDAPGGVGSVAGGGRYDKLVGSLMGKSQAGKESEVPCIGVSIGIERLFAIMEMKAKNQVRTTETEVFVASAHKGLTEERLKLAARLWAAGIKAEMPYKKNPKLLDQMQYCESRQIPLAIILGEDELKQGVFKIRTVTTREDNDIPAKQLIEHLRRLLDEYHATEVDLFAK